MPWFPLVLFVFVWNTFEPDNMTDSDNVKAKYISKLLQHNVEDLGEIANGRLHRGQPACGMFHFCWKKLNFPCALQCSGVIEASLCCNYLVLCWKLAITLFRLYFCFPSWNIQSECGKVTASLAGTRDSRGAGMAFSMCLSFHASPCFPSAYFALYSTWNVRYSCSQKHHLLQGAQLFPQEFLLITVQSFLKSSLHPAGKIWPFIVIKIVLTFLLPHCKTEGGEFCNV